MTTIDGDQVFEFIVRYKREHDGLAPTVREIMHGVGVQSTSVVVFHLEKLEGQGRIRLLGWGMSRGIMVVGGRWTLDIHRAQASLGPDTENAEKIKVTVDWNRKY